MLSDSSIYRIGVTTGKKSAARQIYAQKMATEMEGEFVVFLIGMRINKPWKIHKWLRCSWLCRACCNELARHPAISFLGHVMSLGVIVQYWRSFEDLEAYARSHDYAHWPAWVAFKKRVQVSNGDVGIWHEAYRIAPGQYEAIYASMPAFGLGSVGHLVPAQGHPDSARPAAGTSDQATTTVYR